MENRLSKTRNLILLALLCGLLWGSATPAIKTGYRLFGIAAGDNMTILLFAGTRFFLAGIITIAAGSIMARRLLIPRKGSWGMVGALAAFQTVIQYTFFYIGLSNSTGVKGTIISGTSTFFAVLISAIIFRMEELTFRKIIACIIGFAGIIVLNLNGFELSFKLGGEGALVLANVSYAISSVLIKRFSTREDPVAMSGWQFSFGGLVLMIIGAAGGGRLGQGPVGAWILLLYLGALSAVAYTVWSLLLKYNPVSKVTVFSLTIPIFGVLLSLIILKESVNYIQCAAAMLLVCLGIYLVNSKLAKKK